MAHGLQPAWWLDENVVEQDGRKHLVQLSSEKGDVTLTEETLTRTVLVNQALLLSRTRGV